ncbi:MAG: cyclic nucleotide-binding domain-containing protein [Thermodesulfobacteriota bacterium]|nr:cyclic nucleotide-binding domain-containing protein [Thermodesulfobacteriota bacterium]
MIESKYLTDNIKNIKQLLSIPALRNFETKALGQMLRLSKIRQYEDGEIIIKEGDLDRWLYFLLSGKIRIEKEGVSICTISKMGEIFGEMRIIDTLSRSASVYAVGKTVCMAVNTSGKEKSSPEDESAYSLLLLYRVLAEYISIRLRLTNEELVKLKKDVDRQAK